MKARAVWLTVLVVACGGTQQPTTVAPASGAPVRPLSEFVASAGLRWLVLVEPRALLEHESIRAGFDRIAPDERLRAFQGETGVDLPALTRALVAGTDYATWWMASVPRNTEIEERFRERLVEPQREKHPGPGLRVLSGLVGRTPETMASYDHQWVGVAVGDPTPARVAAAYALGRLKSPSAFAGAALRTLPADLTAAPLVAVASGPFDADWLGGAHGLLAVATAAGASVTPRGDDTLRLRVVIAGGFGATDHAEERLTRTWSEMTTSGVGRVLGLDAGAPRVTRTPQGVELVVELRTRRVMEGLYSAVAADARTLLTPPSDAQIEPR